MINREIDEAIEDILRRLRFGIVVLLTVLVLTSITLNEVRRRDELRRHMNYASLTHGALIVDHTATMSELDGVKALTKNSPEIVIRVNKNLILPGSCWPFVGGKGFLTIELAETIIATGFIYEHLPLTFIPHPVTAPHVFNMTGYKSAAALEADDGCALGQATFDPTATQKETIAHRFPNGTCGPIRFIRFEILDNLGGDYTCVYRIHITGHPSYWDFADKCEEAVEYFYRHFVPGVKRYFNECLNFFVSCWDGYCVHVVREFFSF